MLPYSSPVGLDDILNSLQLFRIQHAVHVGHFGSTVTAFHYQDAAPFPSVTPNC